MLKQNISTIAMITLCVALVGCGGGGSSDSDTDSPTENAEMEINDEETQTETILTGIFIDSAVEGATYSTATQSGTTNSSGEFNYIAGEQVTFSIGATQLPVVVAAAQVSPVDMAQGSPNPADTTTNIARLLQSLDTDGDPDNGITISAEAAANVAVIDFNVSAEEFANNTDVINLVANSGSTTTALISAQDANAHLNDTLGIANEASSSTDNLDGNVTLETLAGFYDSRGDVIDRQFYLLINADGTGVEYGQPLNGESCFEVDNFVITSLGGDLFNLDRSSRGAEELRIERQNGSLIITSDGPDSVVFPQETTISASDLILCEQMGNAATSGVFNVDNLIAGSPWFSIRDFGTGGRPDTCGNSYSFSNDGVFTIITKSIDATDFQSFNGTYTLSESGVLTVVGDGMGDNGNGQFVLELNELSLTSWSTNRLDNDDAGDFLEVAFNDRESALLAADQLGTNCEFNLPM